MRRRLGFAFVLCAVAVTTAACSSGSGGTTNLASQSPTQILDAARQALSSASSVRLTGHISQASQTAILDITSFANGDYSGTISFNGDTARLMRIGNTDYLNASASFYEAQNTSAAAAQLLGGKWVYGSNSQIGLGSAFSLRSLGSQITKPKGVVTKGAKTTVDGQPAIPLHSGSGTLWVATTGTAYPVQVAEAGTTPGVIHFSQWNQGSTPTPPSGAVSINSLAGSAA